MEMVSVTCPTCFEAFEIPAPPASEVPAQLDYDCEICCRPMVIYLEARHDGLVTAEARGLDE